MVDSKKDIVSGRIIHLDTSVLIEDPFAIEKLGEYYLKEYSERINIVVSLTVIQELDKLKGATGIKGKNARTASRLIEEYRTLNQNEAERGVLHNGVITRSGAKLFVDFNGMDTSILPTKLDNENDNRIIANALSWQARYKKRQVILYTKDTNMRVVADVSNLKTLDYRLYSDSRLVQDIVYETIWPGIKKIKLTMKNSGLISKLHLDKKINLSEFKIINPKELSPNQCCIIYYKQDSGLCIYNRKDNQLEYVEKYPKKDDQSKKKLRPLNIEQSFAYHLLKDPRILILVIAGPPGTGKNFITLLAGLEQLSNNDEYPYEKVHVYRPNTELGDPFGFLPGSLEEKFGPFIGPIACNIKKFLKLHKFGNPKIDGQKDIFSLIKEGVLEVSPINYIQGMTIEGFMIVDEFQNIKQEDADILGTRPGDNSKLVINGDLYQVFSDRLDIRQNGLSYFCSLLKNEESFACVVLKDAVRSKISAIVNNAKNRMLE